MTAHHAPQVDPLEGPPREIGAVLAALADPTRREVLEALVDAGQASATTIARRLPVSRQAVVKHLQVLEAAGLAEHGRVGREVRYSPRPGGLVASAHWLVALSAWWDRRLGALKRAAEAPPGEGQSAASRPGADAGTTPPGRCPGGADPG